MRFWRLFSNLSFYFYFSSPKEVYSQAKTISVTALFLNTNYGFVILVFSWYFRFDYLSKRFTVDSSQVPNNKNSCTKTRHLYISNGEVSFFFFFNLIKFAVIIMANFNEIQLTTTIIIGITYFARGRILA